jgi:uroporphyrinogen III methyltransferase / synthase
MRPDREMTRQDAASTLMGRRVMVTRPCVENSPPDPLVERLRELVAEVIVQPAIRIGPPADWQPVDDALARIDQFDWLVFSSVNGVRFLLERMLENGDLQRIGAVKLAAIGPGTAEELGRYRLEAELVPSQFRAESLAEALAENASGKRFLLARASRGREVLAEQLAAAGAVVEQIVVYGSTDVEEANADVAAMLSAGQIDWVTVTSSAIARSLAKLFGEKLRRSKLASISPITSGVLRELGYEPAVEAGEYTMPGLVAAIARAS